MADEAVIIRLLGNAGNPTTYTVADGTGIEKGTLCQLTEPSTASAGATAKPFAGIAAAEKVASDGATTLSFYTLGIFDLKDSGAGITAGDLVALSGGNTIFTATATEVDGGMVVGKALETASADEVIAVWVGGH
jgi:hypothetical protein